MYFRKLEAIAQRDFNCVDRNTSMRLSGSIFGSELGNSLSVAGACLTSKTTMIDSCAIFTALQRDMVEDDVGVSRGCEAERENDTLHSI